MKKLFVICFVCISQTQAGVGRDLLDSAVREIPGGNIVAGTILKPKPVAVQTNQTQVANIQTPSAEYSIPSPSGQVDSLTALLRQYSHQITSLQQQIHEERSEHSETKDSLKEALDVSGVPYSGLIATVIGMAIPLLASLFANLKFVKKHPALVRASKQMVRKFLKEVDSELANRAANSKDGQAIQAIADTRNVINNKAIDTADEIEEKLVNAK